MITVDTLLFSNAEEITILKAKLKEEQKFIDHFVVIENNYNLKGHPKSTHENLIYNEFKDLHNSKRLTYININQKWDSLTKNEYTSEAIPFKREALQRGIGIEYALENLNADIIFVTDADEIIKESIKSEFNTILSHDFIHLPHITYTFNLRTINDRFRFSTVLNSSKLNRRKSRIDLGTLRQKKDANYLISPIKHIEHYTNQLTPKEIHKKINAFAHHSTYTIDDIVHAIEYGHELCNTKDLNNKLSDTLFWNRQASAQELADRCDAICELDTESDVPNYIENRKKLGFLLSKVSYLHLGSGIESKIKRLYGKRN